MLIATLCPDTKALKATSVAGMHFVRVPYSRREPYRARAEVFQYAQKNRHAYVLVRAAGTRAHARRGLLRGPMAWDKEFALMRFAAASMKELKNGNAAVFMPPMAAADQLPALVTYNHPVIPKVAVYRTASVLAVAHDDACLGYNLINNGEHMVVLSTFAYTGGDSVYLDEWGTASKWCKL
jgi:hypothetical protein